MPFGKTADIWLEFNTYEALFWFALGVATYVFLRRTSLVPRAWVVFSVANILLLASTDIVQVYTGGFFHTAPWLLYWKSVQVLGLMVSVIWYIRFRWYV
jgi:hypothetical protein